MAFILTPLGSDNFTPDSSPVNQSKWEASTATNPSFAQFNAAGGFAVGTAVTGHFSVDFWKEEAIPNNCYCSVDWWPVNVNDGSSGFDLNLRTALDFGNDYLFLTITNNTDGTVSVGLFENSGGGATIGSLPFTQGDTFTFIAIGTTAYALHNGVQILSLALQAPQTGFVGIDCFEQTAGAARLKNFVAGSASLSGAYSVPDCRIATATTPNNSRNVQGTLIYDVQKAESRASGAPVDSRTSGAPVDSRATGQAPQNSRTPGIYGPGVN